MHLTKAELTAGWRLACVQHIDQNLVIEIPEVEEVVRAKELLNKVLHIRLDAGINKAYLELPKPDRADHRPDTVRIQEELGGNRLTFPLPILKKVTGVLKQGDFKVTLARAANQVLDVEPDNTSEAIYGVAIDVGTTTLAVYLLNLKTGEELAVRSTMNPQRSFGDDVISRIKYVHDHGEEGLRELQKTVITGVNLVIRQ